MRIVQFIIVLLLISTTSTSQVILNNDLTPTGTISVQPMKNNFALKAGESQEVKIFISNKMGSKLQFNVYLGDWSRDTLGSHVYNVPGSQTHSCADWITFDKKFVEVDSGAIGIVTVKLQVPETAEAVAEMKWAMLFIENIRESKAPTETKLMRTEIIPSTRFGLHIYQTPPLVIKKEIKLTAFSALASRDGVFRIICENTGQMQLNCKSYIELSSLEDGKKITCNPIEVPLFPGQIRYVDFSLPDGTKKGRYTLVGIVDPGDEMDIEAAQLIINVQ